MTQTKTTGQGWFTQRKRQIFAFFCVGCLGLASYIFSPWSIEPVFLQPPEIKPFARIQSPATKQLPATNQSVVTKQTHVTTGRPATQPTTKSSPSKKYILLYNDFFGDKHWTLGDGSKVFESLHCRFTNCFITSDKTLFQKSAAVAFHVPRMSHVLPTGRPPGQVWLFYAWESPVNFGKLPDSWRTQFNWSLTYRRNSDYFMPYGEFSKRDSLQVRNWTEVVKRKTKAVAWFVSNCRTHSKRSEYVNRLSKLISVDTYGACGDKKCSRSETNKCLDMLTSEYKFYLGFENSFCDDYITEKFFDYASKDVVVVVRGAANYSISAPPYSFINAADFESPEKLGEYLKHLDTNPKEYIKYLKWKENFKSHTLGLRQQLWCDICRDLNNQSAHRSAVINPYDLWFGDGVCRSPSDL